MKFFRKYLLSKGDRCGTYGIQLFFDALGRRRESLRYGSIKINIPIDTLGVVIFSASPTIAIHLVRDPIANDD